MKNIILLHFLLFAIVGIGKAQASKEEDFMKSFFETWKSNDKTVLANDLLLKESDLEAYNASQKALGSTNEFSKKDFAKFIEEKNNKITREFDELRSSAAKSKITFENTKFGSYRKIADPTVTEPAGYYKLLFKFHDVYTFKIQLQCVPVGDGYRLFNLLDNVTM